MKALLDTDVVLDLLLDRPPHAAPAARLFAAIERHALVGCLCATTGTTIHYLVARTVGTVESIGHIEKLLSLFDVAPVNRAVLEGALALPGFTDFEDAVLHEAARLSDADAIVTRNGDDFRTASLPIYSPAELLQMLGAISG